MLFKCKDIPFIVYLILQLNWTTCFCLFVLINLANLQLAVSKALTTCLQGWKLSGIIYALGLPHGIRLKLDFL